MRERWVFTFGGAHVHPTTGESLKNCFVEIEGDFSEARDVMVRHFGLKWSMQYPSRDAAGVDKYGLDRIDLPPALENA